MPFDLTHYMIRRKVLKIFGGSFHVYDEAGQVVGFSSQKAFKLKEDIRLFSDESKQTELLSVMARQIVDFSAAYDVVDSQSGQKVGALRRKGWSSLVRDSWELLDENDTPIARLKEDSTTKALLRRFFSNLIPQHFSLETNDGRAQADLRVRFNPFVYKLHVDLVEGCEVDSRLVLAAGILLAAIEGRQN